VRAKTWGTKLEGLEEGKILGQNFGGQFGIHLDSFLDHWVKRSSVGPMGFIGGHLQAVVEL